jgi:hypothetical protein
MSLDKFPIDHDLQSTKYQDTLNRRHAPQPMQGMRIRLIMKRVSLVLPCLPACWVDAWTLCACADLQGSCLHSMVSPIRDGIPAPEALKDGMLWNSHWRVRCILMACYLQHSCKFDRIVPVHTGISPMALQPDAQHVRPETLDRPREPLHFCETPTTRAVHASKSVGGARLSCRRRVPGGNNGETTLRR